MNQNEAIQALKGLEMTQEQIARELRVSVSTVNRWLNGHFKPIKYVLPDIERLCASKKPNYPFGKTRDNSVSAHFKISPKKLKIQTPAESPERLKHESR